MKHIRGLEIDQPLDSLLEKRAAENAVLDDEKNAGPNFFRGLIIALAISLKWSHLFGHICSVSKVYRF